MNEVRWIYVGTAKDTGALGFTHDLNKANRNFAMPFTAYIQKDDHDLAMRIKALEYEGFKIKNANLETEFKKCADFLTNISMGNFNADDIETEATEFLMTFETTKF